MEILGIPVSNVDTERPYREAIKEIRLIILNVDGVLTDGYIQYTESGDEIKTFYARDGFAIREAMKQGLKITVISERQSRATMRRLIELGVTDIYLGIRNKFETYQELKILHGLEDKHCLYIGDDISDLPILEKVGFSCAPINAIDYLRNRVAYVSPYEGGRGCVRDVIETVLIEQGKWKHYKEP
ncbi:MAG: HAD-IIIA family hydrolase [Chloroherpetonaceae bacterium]|nr:HAD-IIIA family hydrolase [Chloroherpetonaceae bacterium]MDW8437860.1 HAD-IIIA family hydrolase [Chloroherpetonaceae bacterium]